MLQIYCPYCAELREEHEFHYAGEAHIVRPKQPESVSDQTWGEYLFHRKNPKVSTKNFGFIRQVVGNILMLAATRLLMSLSKLIK